MKKNPLKKALKNNTQTYGSWITLGHPLIPEIMAHAGFDWLAIDLEHTSIQLTEMLPMIIAIEAQGIVPLVRVGENNPNLIKQVMDAGAYGVVVANVNSPEEAQQAVDSVKYAPYGKRGVGLYRAQGYGRYFEEYKKWLKNESVVVVQIEHVDAVDRIDDIFSVKGIDAFMIGPYDLSGSMGKPGEFNDPQVSKAIEKVIEAGSRHGLTSGYHSVPSSIEEAHKRKEQGFKMLGYSNDAILLGDKAVEGLSALKNA